MEQTPNYEQQQAEKAAENLRRIEARAREKFAERMRQNDEKRREEQAARLREQDRKRTEEARRREKQQQDLRAKAREIAKEKAAEALKKEREKAKEPEKQAQMHGASKGPSMRPGTGDKQRDTIAAMAEMDHPGLTDGQKLELARQGVAVGEGWHNREDQRKREAEARESRKTPADKAEDQMWFKSGMSYEKRQEMEIRRDKRRVQQIEQGKNKELAQAKEPAQRTQKTQTEKAPAPKKAPAKQFEFSKEPDEPTKGGR